ncbi:hypothetical protein AgCh_002102 [Apium graveolens]
MASDQTNMPELSLLLEQLINSRNRPLSQFSPITLPLTNPQTNTDPDQDSPERSDPHDRIILLNPLTQSMVMIEGSAWRINALLNDLVSSNKDGPPPASKASIEAMQVVETKEGDECVICMEEYIDTIAKEMPCKHVFHGECVEKWLKMNGSCPVCRYSMPVDDNENKYKSFFGGEAGGRRREIWVSFGGTRSENINQRDANDSDGAHSVIQD